MWLFRRSYSFLDMDFRTDVHSHILPAVDDGFNSSPKSVEALRQLHELGLEHSILTPHIYPDIYPKNTVDYIRMRAEAELPALNETGVECRVAGEHMVYLGMESEYGRDMDLLFLSGKSILIEMSYAFESANIREFIFHLNSLGYQPVLAHPERYTYYSKNLDEITSLVERDTKLQLNILSLGGFYGAMAKEKAEIILERGLYSYLGTDLHALSQLNQLKSLKIKRKHLAAIEKLLAGNDLLWSGLQ